MRQAGHYGSNDASGAYGDVPARRPDEDRQDRRRGAKGRAAAPPVIVDQFADGFGVEAYEERGQPATDWGDDYAGASYPGAGYAGTRRRSLRDVRPYDSDAYIPAPPIDVEPRITGRTPSRGAMNAARQPHTRAGRGRPEERRDEPLSTTSARRAVTARPLSAELDHLNGLRSPAELTPAELTPGEHTPAEFTAELDTLISIASARQQAVLPSKTADAKRKRKRLDRLPPAALSVGRALLAFMAAYYVLSAVLAATGHSALPLAPVPAAIGGIMGLDGQIVMDGKVVTRVQPFTQMRRADLYNDQAQFNAWGGSACSAAVLAETLTAYGIKGATIGRMIDELGSDISTQWGLETYDGFNKVAQKHGFRADIYVDQHLSYNQMLYLTNTLGIPVIVNVRATTGYYHYLSGGHFLVMTGGDAGTIRLTDSSLYYIKSLPIATFMGMFRNRTVVIVPQDYHYTLPAA